MTNPLDKHMFMMKYAGPEQRKIHLESAKKAVENFSPAAARDMYYDLVNKGFSRNNNETSHFVWHVESLAEDEEE